VNLVYSLTLLVGDRSQRAIELAEDCLVYAKAEIIGAHDWSWMRAVTTVGVAENVETIAVPSQARRVLSVSSAGKVLKSVPFDEVIKTGVPSGELYGYHIVGRTIYLTPGTHDAATLTIVYTKAGASYIEKPFTLDPIPSELAHIVLDAGYYRYLKTVAGMGEIAETKAKYLDSLQQAIIDDIAKSSPKDVYLLDTVSEEYL